MIFALSPPILFAAEVLLAIGILAAIQLTAHTAAGLVSGVSIRQISFGVGPKLLQFRKFVLQAIPLTGYVAFKDTRAQEYAGASTLPTAHDAYNHQPRIVQAAIVLAGPVALVVVAVVLRYERGLSEVLSGFRQILVGGLLPLSVGQHYLSATQSLAINGGFGALTAVLAGKLAAFNLLPLPVLSGGQALLALLRKPGDAPVVWQDSLSKWAMLPWYALMLGWLVAFVYYVART